MQNIRFVKEPGFVFDVFYVFIASYVKRYFINDSFGSDLPDGERERLFDVLDEYGECSEELLPFFYLPKSGKSMMGLCYFSAFYDRFLTDYSLELVLAEMKDAERVKDTMLRFYFPSISENTLVQCRTSFQTVNRLIKESSYPPIVKSTLYSFFIDPHPVLQTLRDELTAKAALVKQLYDQEQDTLQHLQDTLEHETVMAYFRGDECKELDLTGYAVSVSFCLLNRYVLSVRGEGCEALVILGRCYREAIDWICNEKDKLNMKDFAAVLGEENRLQILDYLLKKGEVTLKEIEQEFGFTSANAYYHISVMMRADALIARNQGRLLYYSINHAAFSNLCERLSVYAASPTVS